MRISVLLDYQTTRATGHFRVRVEFSMAWMKKGDMIFKVAHFRFSKDVFSKYLTHLLFLYWSLRFSLGFILIYISAIDPILPQIPLHRSKTISV